MQPSPWRIERRGTVTTTMDEARTLARAGAPHGTVVVADEMTGGRGTNGRPWHAPPGGLYLSVVLRGIDDPHLLTLALGNAVADALEVAGLDPQVKWVNDVWARGKKVAGILVEGESTGDRLDFLVAGIGVNVNGSASAFPAPLRGAATTIEDELGCDTCIPDLEALVLADVARAVDLVRQGRDDEILASFRRRDALQGKHVLVDEGHGDVAGTAAGIDDKGRLLVKTASGTRPFQAATVRIDTGPQGLQRT